MKTRWVSLSLAVAALGVLAWSGMAQAPPATADMRPVVESYYKIAPGKTDEWLEMYRTHHLPVLQELRREGRLVDIIIYRPFLHQGAPPWDFKVILRWRDFAAMGDRTHEEEIEHRLFTAWGPHRDAENHRWELTEKHWDDIMVVVPE